MSTDPQQLIENAAEAAKRAVQFDNENFIEPSVYYYEIAARLLDQAATLCTTYKTLETSTDTFVQKADEYRKRSEALRDRLEDIKGGGGSNNGDSPSDDGETQKREEMQKGYFLLQEALEEDEAQANDGDDKHDTIELYAKAIEYITQNPVLMETDLGPLALKALERAETLKGEVNKKKI